MSTPPSTITAVVFDFDGVILDSADVKADAFGELYAHHGVDVARKAREHHLANLGIPRFRKLAWIAEHVLGQPMSDAEGLALSQRFCDLALERVLAAPFVPGAESALQALEERGLPMFVASGTPGDELRMIVQRRGLMAWFREVHGAPREKPEVLLDVMARHALAPERVVFIGDGMSDYQAARAAGVAFLARDPRPASFVAKGTPDEAHRLALANAIWGRARRPRRRARDGRRRGRLSLRRLRGAPRTRQGRDPADGRRLPRPGQHAQLRSRPAFGQRHGDPVANVLGQLRGDPVARVRRHEQGLDRRSDEVRQILQAATVFASVVAPGVPLDRAFQGAA